MTEPCCPCDVLVHPPKPMIPAGLSSLPRQLAGFPEYRLAMLREIPTHDALVEWRAREGDDLGLLLIEMWAYVLDVVGFYDERIANEAYLRTAKRRPSLRKLVELIGYLPRPAVSASAVLAAFADEPQPLLVPAGTGFRSQAFGDEAPQVFESGADTLISKRSNEWTLAPQVAGTLGARLLLDPQTAALSPNQLVFVRTPLGLSAARVVAADPIEARDTATYIELRLDPDPGLGGGLALADVELLTPSLTAAPHRAPASGSGLELVEIAIDGGAIGGEILGPGPARPDIVLDSLYSQIRDGDPVIVAHRGTLHAATVTVIATEINLTSEATAPATGLRLSPPLPAGFASGALTVHFNMVEAGRLTRPAKALLSRDELDGAPLESPVEPLDLDPPAALLLHDADEAGEEIGGTIIDNPEGDEWLKLHQDQGELDAPMRTPVKAYGNLVRVTRGESVNDEVLGSGDASQAFQSFTLANKPLTWLSDPEALAGRRSTLSVRVNGLLWKEVASFFGAAPEDEVYIIRENDDEESVVTFGDGVRGSRVPTGVDNVRASYRHGAGAAKPPANSITQLARPIPGLGGVVNPVAAGGGADRDQPADLRRNAPQSSLTLGRAVSLADFEALAREFGGVVNAQVDWAWDGTCQRAVVKVWFIGDGGDIEAALRCRLIEQAEPDTPLQVAEAMPQEASLVIDLEVEERFNSEDVETAVLSALTDPESGLLALENVPIGCPLFRSRLFEQILAVDGAAAVRSMSLDGTEPVPFVIEVEEGRYLDLLGDLRVGGSEYQGG